MTRPRAGLLLLLIQLLLVLTLAGKYLLERHTRPRLWLRTSQADPSLPLRGRYLALQLPLDTCDLPRDKAHLTDTTVYRQPGVPSSSGRTGLFRWPVTLTATNGHLTPHLADPPTATPGDTLPASLESVQSCDQGRLDTSLDLFLPEHATLPTPLRPGQSLWVEVTLPAHGPPRPLHLALSDPTGFHPLP